MVRNLLEFDLEGLVAFCDGLGEKRFRAVQLFRWIHQRGVADFGAMTDLAKSLREKLDAAAEVRALPVVAEHVSADGTAPGRRGARIPAEVLADVPADLADKIVDTARGSPPGRLRPRQEKDQDRDGDARVLRARRAHDARAGQRPSHSDDVATPVAIRTLLEAQPWWRASTGDGPTSGAVEAGIATDTPHGGAR